MAPTGRQVWRDFVTDGVPSSGPHKPSKKDAREWAYWLESLLAAVTAAGGKLYTSRAAMNADLTPAANTPALVIGDPVVANNGLYVKVGAAGSGSWSRVGDVPGYQFVRTENVGAGTANAIVATSALPISGDTLVYLPVVATNTASPVTVSFNGGAALTVKTNGGNDIVVGGLVSGMVLLGVVSGSTFRLVSDQASAAIVAAAEDAADRAEAAEKLAKQYRDEFVQGIASPIYETVSGMATITVPSAIKTIRVNGFSSSRDRQGSLYTRATGQPTGEAAGFAFRTADRFSPDGSTSSANGGWWEYVEKFDMRQVCEKIAARLSRGDRTVIACYGDSITDGSGTTGWTPNPKDGNGDAIGSTDQNARAPNAWAKRASGILTSHYASPNFMITNCGYSGTKMSDGWARRNFTKAVYDNAMSIAGGAPYTVLIAFGANDISDSTVDPAWLDKHIFETRAVCRLAMSLGIIPVLMTCDPMWRSDPAGSDSFKTVEMVDAAKVAVAEEMGIALIDIASDLTNWMAKNKDLHNYFENQSDALHGGDVWNAFKGGAIARHFMRNYVRRVAGRGPQRISGSDAAYKNFLGRAQIYQTKQSRDGAIYLGARTAPVVIPNGLVGDVWIWNEDPDAELIYRGVGHENYASEDIGVYDKPKHVIIDFTNMSSKSGRVPSGVGFALSGHALRVDSPYRVGKLAYGMNRVQHSVGNAPYYFVGHYEVRSTGEWRRDKYGANASAFPYAIPLNAMKDQGRLIMDVDRSVAGSSIVFMPEAADFSNVVGLMDGDKAQLHLRAVLPVTCGIILGWTPSYMNRTGDRDNKAFMLLYKSAATTVQLFIGSVNNGAVTYTQLASGTITQTADAEGAEKYTFLIYRSSDTMRFTLSEGWDLPGASVIDYTGAAGAVTIGGAFVMGGLQSLISAATGAYNPKILEYFGKQQTLFPGVPEPAISAP